ncbi:c-type cytochrome domain-containing protein [Aporhodopirellula aestuarii]|uniref:Cytochrome C n=1 Tax=Aporhodopirellula aestuarii TaxID=2950107 RepID=A0ABT0U1V3_9BACT|nr:c-type cytochrome domain-containing protein [Aporhodopirellula aestuarii]MCM2370879.1 cytochrome C [Aporhodopirellula aestuarii]
MFAAFAITTLVAFAPVSVHAQTDVDEAEIEQAAGETVEVVAIKRMAVDAEGRVVNFVRDIAPIFRTHCLECHGPDEAKNDFRIDDPDLVFDYVEAEDAMSSSLFTDYMTTDDDDMLMPPRGHGGPLSASELALVRLWIDEGAHWPEDAMLDGSGAPLPTEQELSVEDMGVVARVWSFQGFLHPATVHFPIAMLVVGALFVVLGWKWPTLGTQIPLACLLIGAGSSIVATMMGWSFSVEKGYGSWARMDFDADIFWHRWTAVIVTVSATLFAIIALMSLRTHSPRLTTTWKIGLLVVAGLVGAVGHQGGELTYGKDFYPKAFSILLGKPLHPDDSEAIDIELQEIETIDSQPLAAGD